MDTSNKKREVKLSTVIYSILTIAIGIVFILLILIYVFNWKNSFIEKAEKIIPYPAVLADNARFISISDLNSNLNSVKRFYENQDFSKVNVRIDFSTDEGKKRLKMKEKEILNRMIEDKAIEILANRNGIKITGEMVDQNLNRKLEEYGTGDDLKNNLDHLYGWTTEDFKEKVIKPDLYKQELEKIFLSQDNSAETARDKIKKAQEELNKKKPFAEVAKTYSEGSTAQDGGELGWFRKDQLIPDIADAVFSLEKGKRSDILESSLGFHIIEVEDKKTEDSGELANIRQIFIPKKTFADFLTEEMKKMKFSVFLKDYSWNQEKSELEFRDENMRKTEQEIINNSQGDASIIF